jgi:D-3-phosphoglycerate dehydrogenase
MYLETAKMRCLILDDIHEVFIQNIQSLGIQIVKQLDLSSVELENIITDFQIIVINSKVKVDKVLLDKAVNLKYILRPGSGMENVDVDYAEYKGIICLNSPEGNCNAVAEHTLAMILMWHHKILKSANEVKNGIWLRKENTGDELAGKTIGIIGYGNVGKAFAEKLKCLDVKVFVYDKYLTNYGDEKIIKCDLETIMNEADIFSFHIPQTTETINLVNDDFINKMKKNALLINTSRGKIVKTESVVNALKSKKLCGACLDVLENENLESYNNDEKKLYHYLFNTENVIVTPHIAGWTNEAKYKMALVLFKKFKKIFHN